MAAKGNWVGSRVLASKKIEAFFGFLLPRQSFWALANSRGFVGYARPL